MTSVLAKASVKHIDWIIAATAALRYPVTARSALVTFSSRSSLTRTRIPQLADCELYVLQLWV